MKKTIKKIIHSINMASMFKICIRLILIGVAILIAAEIAKSQITGAPLDMDKILNLIAIAKKLIWLLT